MLALAQVEPRSSPPPLAVVPSPVSVRWPGSGYGNKAFTGREWDPETGLYYYRARYYDPKIGRFISEDPIGLAGGVNLYRYVSNRPTVLVDPLGLVNLNLFSPSAPQWADAEVTKTPEGTFSVAGHGNIWEVFDYRSGTRRALTTQALADEIKRAGWTSGTPIYLLTCESGTGKGYFSDWEIQSNAAALAKLLNTRVYGATKFMWWDPLNFYPENYGIYGEKYVNRQRKPNRLDPGKLVPFEP